MLGKIVQLLCWIGLTRRLDDGKLYSPFSIGDLAWWRFKWALATSKGVHRERFVGFFRNRPGIVKWRKGRLLPRRWGIYIGGFEFGDRGG